MLKDQADINPGLLQGLRSLDSELQAVLHYTGELQLSCREHRKMEMLQHIGNVAMYLARLRAAIKESDHEG